MINFSSPEPNGKIKIKAPLFRGDDWGISTILSEEAKGADVLMLLLSSEKAVEWARYILMREAEGFPAPSSKS